MAVYLAGPMRGIPSFNFPAFHTAAIDLRGRGLTVWSPAEADENTGWDPDTDWPLPIADYMARDLPQVCRAEAVIVLPGWQTSQGASLEVTVAKACGIPVVAYHGPGNPLLEYLPEPAGTILDTAARLTAHDRNGVYGHPADDFGRTAQMWAAMFGRDFTAVDVAYAMVAVKLSRLAETPGHRDSLADIAGYARAAEMVLDRH